MFVPVALFGQEISHNCIDQTWSKILAGSNEGMVALISDFY